MINNLTSGWFSLLRNDEHPVLIEQISLVMDKYVPDDENVKEAAARVKSHLEPLKLVKVRSLKQELTPELRKLHAQRRQTLVSLRGQVRSLARSTIAEEQQAATTLSVWLSKHGNTLYRLGYAALTERINEIISDAKTKEKVTHALAALSLTALMEKLESLNETFKEVFNRGKDNASKVQPVDSKSIRRASDKDVRLLFNVIQTGVGINGEENYKPAILALKKFLDYYRFLVLSRKTRKVTEKKSEEETSNPELPLQDDSIEEVA
jgi:hypothetical protein